MQTLRFFVAVSPLIGLFLPMAHAQSPISPQPTVDLTRLKQALAPLASPGLLQSRSFLQVSGSKNGISFTFHEQISAVAKRPGKFRADITQFAADGSPQARFQVISNGLQVWTYRPGAQEYSSQPAKAFHAANDDMTATGLAMGGFFLGEGHELAQGLQSITRETNGQALATLAKLGITVTERTEGVDGEDDYVYCLTLSKQGVIYHFAINPATTALRQVQLTGRQNGISMTFQETISVLTIPVSLAKTTFQFSPPVGVSKTAGVSVDPF